MAYVWVSSIYHNTPGDSYGTVVWTLFPHEERVDISQCRTPATQQHTDDDTHIASSCSCNVSLLQSFSPAKTCVFPLHPQDDVTSTKSCAPQVQLNLKHLHFLTQNSVICIES